MRRRAHAHSPSPNLSAISASSASMASCSCAPLVSISTEVPMPAASIITPMMLLALMRRSPRLMKTSQGKLPARLVSLADARACRPSLLLMVVWVLIMRSRVLVLGCRDGHLHHSLGAPHHGALDQGVQRLGPVAHGAQQHRQVHAGHQPGLTAFHQSLRNV